MTTNVTTKNANDAKATNATKHQRVIDLLSQDGGASLEDMSAVTNWLPHSTRAFLTGLKKKGYTITSEKAEGVRCYHTVSLPTNCKAK